MTPRLESNIVKIVTSNLNNDSSKLYKDLLYSLTKRYKSICTISLYYNLFHSSVLLFVTYVFF